MTPTSGSLSHPITLDYENTLVLAIELSKASWVLAAQVPGLPRIKAKQTIEPRTEALLAAINGYRVRSRAAGRTIERVVAIYEAGWSGFWLARWLARHGVETHVVQPSSVPVDRRARRAKSDGIDAELLLRTVLAWFRGEPRVCSMVPISRPRLNRLLRSRQGKTFTRVTGCASAYRGRPRARRRSSICSSCSRRVSSASLAIMSASSSANTSR